MNKPVFIVLPGPSVEHLEQHIIDIDDLYPDAIWATVNRYKLLEEGILSKVNKYFEVLFYSDPHLLKHYLQDVYDFLNRPYNKTFITDYDIIKSIEQLGEVKRISTDNGAIIYSSSSRGKNLEVVDQFYNSLTAMLLTLIGLGHREFVLFGADGAGAYYGEQTEKYGLMEFRDGVDFTEIQRRLREDTVFMNTYFWKLKDEITPETVSVINCSPGTYLTCFDTVGVGSIL